MPTANPTWSFKDFRGPGNVCHALWRREYLGSFRFLERPHVLKLISGPKKRKKEKWRAVQLKQSLMVGCAIEIRVLFQCYVFVFLPQTPDIVNVSALP